MADQFARQKSTRWAKADVPSYGGWGDEYDDYNDEPQEDVSPVSSVSHQLQAEHLSTSSQPIASASTLVLTIDKLKSGNDDDDELDSSFENESNHHDVHTDAAHAGQIQADSGSRAKEVQNTESTDEGNSFSARSASPLLARSIPPTDVYQGNAPVPDEVHADKKLPPSPLKDTSHSQMNEDLLPPTPTYQTEHKPVAYSPDHDQSDRSYLSDADSIQREPMSLNLGSFKETPPHASQPIQTQQLADSEGDREVAKPETSVPDTLILSIDRLNTNHDDSSLDGEIAQDEYLFNESSYDIGGQRNGYGLVEDNSDRRKNSGHSSNLETAPDALGAQELASNEPLNVLEGVASAHKHKVDTEALDSLINSLLKMENPSDIDDEVGEDLLAHVNTLSRENFVTNHLPTYDSIHDLSLPNFENRFLTDEESEPVPIQGIPEEGLKSKHETFVANVRRPSIKKAPSTAAHEESIQEKTRDQNSSALQDKDLIAEELEESPENPDWVDKTAQETTQVAAQEATEADTDQETVQGIADLGFAQPPQKNLNADLSEVSRRSSTISNATFNMGAWNPNTSKYREKFVNDNDNESQFNMSIHGKNDAAYKKFTGMGQESNYAESVADSIMSVPETIEANLHKINEDQSEDDEEQPDCTSAFSSPKMHATFSSAGNSSVPSVLREHQYEKGKFQEQSPHSSMLRIENLEAEDDCKSTLGESKATSSRSASYSSTKAALKKYPVFSWKSIMSVSQPVDRINMLKKARHDEEMYDTGLSSWLNDVLKSTESSSPMQIGKLATHAYQNAQHSDIRRHTSIRSKVNQVRDKLDSGNFEKASSLGKKFFSRGKKFMKQGSE